MIHAWRRCDGLLRTIRTEELKLLLKESIRPSDEAKWLAIGRAGVYRIADD
jgi:hypothetical protein